jgi:DNA-binding MarR family transcriptional regulator
LTTSLFKELINKGVDITQYLLLHFLNCNIDLKDVNVKILGKLLVLEKQRMINRLGDIWEITEKGKQLLGQERRETPVVLQQDWVEELYEQIEAAIFKNTGKKQYINPNTGKPLKPSLQEFKARIALFFKKFGEQDQEKIKKTLLKYIKEVTSGKIKYPMKLVYYIWNEKNGSISSEMLDNFEEEDVEETLNVGSVDI